MENTVTKRQGNLQLFFRYLNCKNLLLRRIKPEQTEGRFAAPINFDDEHPTPGHTHTSPLRRTSPPQLSFSSARRHSSKWLDRQSDECKTCRSSESINPLKAVVIAIMPVYNFKKMSPVPAAPDLIDIVLMRTQRKTPTIIHPGYKITRIRSF